MGEGTFLRYLDLQKTYLKMAAIQSAIEALRNQDIRGLVTLGPALEIDRFNIPENVQVVQSAPHSEVFPLADLVITHAGHGTIMRALSNGLPLVCLPMGRDQNDNAIKVASHGCGIALSAKTGPGKIRKAVQRILTEDSYKQSAESFRKDLLGGDLSSFVLKELEDLIAPLEERGEAIGEARVRYA